jgi:hypothetical protein
MGGFERLVFVLIACGIVWLAVLLILPARRGCGSWTVATATRLRMIGMAAEGYSIDIGNGHFPNSVEAFRAYWPDLPYDVVFTFDEAIPSMLQVSADPRETPYVWLAEHPQADAANPLIALKRVDHGEARDTVVLLYGDMSVRYVKTEDLAGVLRSLRNPATAPGEEASTAPRAAAAFRG